MTEQTLTALGPVSEVLERELREQVRRNGVVVWLDSDGSYTDVAEKLEARSQAGELPYAVRGYRGSFLELMLALGDVEKKGPAQKLVVHLPGFSEETVKATPMLELYRSGVRFRKALPTLVTEAAAQRVAPATIDSFVGGNDLSLEAADAWLQRELAGEGGSSSTLLGQPPSTVYDLVRKAELGVSSDDLAAYFETSIGAPRSWSESRAEAQNVQTEEALFGALSWALCVEYFDDLQHPPVTEALLLIAKLPKPLVRACRELAQHVRSAHPLDYEREARQTEAAMLSAEVQNARAEDLGKVDTFAFEDAVVLRASIEALANGDYPSAQAWATQRISGDSFWLRQQPLRANEWRLVQAAAELGVALDAATPELDATTHDEAIERYLKVGARVDRAHRHLEQAKVTSLDPVCEHFERLRPALDSVVSAWRAWADGWARAFCSLCESEGYLPAESRQQRTLFDGVVRGQTKAGKTALFMVDALRYEMAEELAAALEKGMSSSVRLQARYAELPTDTVVGMNVLAPVSASGMLQPELKDGKIVGFSTGEFRVHNPETRKRAMRDRISGDACAMLSLAEAKQESADSLKKKVASGPLLIVHSEEIDKAGETDIGPRVFEQILADLRGAWLRLHKAGVKNFVFTSDHGFLLLHNREDHVLQHGKTGTANRRYALASDSSAGSEEVCVPLESLRYDGVDGAYLKFPKGIDTYNVANQKSAFVHGGNSLQERLIPVLEVTHKSDRGGDYVQYSIEAEKRDGLLGTSCISLKVEVASQEALSYATDPHLELVLRSTADVVVDIVQLRGGGELRGGSILAPVGEEIEVFFRLRSNQSERAQLEVRSFDPDASVSAFKVAALFDTEANADRSAAQSSPPAPVSIEGDSPAWLDQLPDEKVCAIFLHLSKHGTLGEEQATTILGGQRALRKFSRKFEEYRAVVPFQVRVEMADGKKTYIKEGGS